MDFWKNVDLTTFTPVPLSELEPGKKYICMEIKIFIQEQDLK